MRNSALLATGLLLAASACVFGQPGNQTGKTSPYEEVVVQLMTSMEKMTKALADVKDGPTAEAALPQLKQAAAQFVDVRKKSEQLKQPDKAEKDRITAKFQKKMAEVSQKLSSEVRRISGISGAQPVLKEIQEVLKPPKQK